MLILQIISWVNCRIVLVYHQKRSSKTILQLKIEFLISQSLVFSLSWHGLHDPEREHYGIEDEISN